MGRLEAVADLVPPCVTVADIGCDHGLLSAMLVGRGTAQKAIACDISAPSLKKAAELTKKSGLAIETRLGDGLQPIGANEAQAAVIAGMGGYEILHILADPRRTDGITRFVVSPQSDLPVFRGALNKLGLAILRERVVREGKHFYFVMVLGSGDEKYSPLELEFGLSLREPDETFLAYLDWRERLLADKMRRYGSVTELRDQLERVRQARIIVGKE